MLGKRPASRSRLYLPLLALAACAGPAESTRKSLTSLLAKGEYHAAQSLLAKTEKKEYGPSNAVLYDLDLAMVLHYAGNYGPSGRHFNRAQDRMDELFTISASKTAGAVLANENVRDYPGEYFEKALSHVFCALDFAFLGQIDEALVEARRVEAWLDGLDRNAGPRRGYRDDAFARVLSGMLYEDAGKFDDARISYEAALKAYARYAEVYSLAIPDLSTGSLAGKGEIVFLHYNGFGPRKVRKRLGGIMGPLTNISYPEYRQDPFSIAESEIEAGGLRADSVLMEDISAIAVKELSERVSALKARSAMRSALKTIGEAATGINSSRSEFADTRGWTTLPAQIRMAQLRMNPGRYRVTVRFKDAGGLVKDNKLFDEVTVKEGRRTFLHSWTPR